MVSHCQEAIKAWPRSLRTTFTGQFLNYLKYHFGAIKAQLLTREQRVRSADEAALRSRLEAERQAAEVRLEAEQKAAEIRAKAEECRQQCPQELTAMLVELRSLGTDEQSIKRLHELDGEHQALISQMSADVAASLKVLNDTFVAEYANRNVALSKAEEQLRQQREAEAEKRRQEAEAEKKKDENEQKTAAQFQQLQMLYMYYMELQVCAERFTQFENVRSGLRDVLKSKETSLPPEQVERIWNATAEKFKQLEAVLKVVGDAQLYTECEQNSEYVAGLILLVPGMGGPPQNAPLRKKDF
jgi:hypothetical protein